MLGRGCVAWRSCAAVFHQLTVSTSRPSLPSAHAPHRLCRPTLETTNSWKKGNLSFCKTTLCVLREESSKNCFCSLRCVLLPLLLFLLSLLISVCFSPSVALSLYTSVKCWMHCVQTLLFIGKRGPCGAGAPLFPFVHLLPHLFPLFTFLFLSLALPMFFFCPSLLFLPE